MTKSSVALAEEPHSHGAAQGRMDLEDFIELGFPELLRGPHVAATSRGILFVCVPASLFRFMRSHTINYRASRRHQVVPCTQG